MAPDIRFCTTPDGVKIAYSAEGDGPLLVAPPGWITNLGREVPSTIRERLTQTHTVVSWDKQGCGLSERSTTEFSIERGVIEAKAVLDDLGADQADFLGISQGGPIAVMFAAEHPERVGKLALYASFADGPTTYFKPAVRESMLAVVRSHWGIGSKVLTDMFTPGASLEEADKMAKHQRESASAEVAAGYLELAYSLDVTDAAKQVTTPTIVLHRRGDRAVPIAGGQQLAALIPGAHFVPLEGTWHVPRDEEEASDLAALIDQHLLEGETTSQAAAVAPTAQVASAAGEVQVILFTDLESSTELTTSLGDERAQEVLHGHNDTVRAALAEHSGREVKHTGDGIMATFSSPAGAVAALMDIQRGLTGGEVRVRVGINAGEPIAEDDDLFGTAVILAARICDRAEPGQVLVADVVRQLVAGKGFTFEDAGDVTLKGFDAPVTLHTVRP
ncbi:MAG TPA: alpha/beta fold hydrolase [Dehalococcoidia bacterium]|nr:alpha/beta fold hydrolase [Dehalococcoidia bacterium]